MRALETGDLALRWVVVLGIVSISALVLGAWLVDREAGHAFEALGALGRVEARTATAHLWLEELVSGDEISSAQVRQPLEGARTAWGELLSLERGAGIPTQRLEEITFQLDRFERLSLGRLERFGSGEAVAAGSSADEEYDRVFDDLESALSALRVALDDHLLELRSTARRGLALLVGAWLLLVSTASVVLVQRRSRVQRTESALAQSQDRFFASQKLEAVGRLAGGVAHDINNYLAGINAQCELVLRRTDDESVKKRMGIVIATIFRASALVQQLLAFSRRQPSRPQVIDLESIVLRLEPMIRQLVGASIRLLVRGGDGDRPLVWADPVHVEQVVLNLVVNAREAMREGGRLEIVTRREGEEAVLEVRDEGVGIPAEHLGRIFEPFFTSKSRSGASGLGLATVHGIVEQAGGRIEVESTPGRGTTFVIRCPLARLEDDRALDDPERNEPATGGDESILYVEDNPELREASVAMLRALGYEITAAASGEAALDELHRFGEHGPDLLIADLVLPGVGGRELSDRLQKRFPKLRSLFVSGYSDDPELLRRIRDGEAMLLEKPFTSQSLLRGIRDVLDDRPRAP